MAKSKRVMPKFTKAPPALVALFDSVISSVPSAERRTMFGYPAAFVAGLMAFGLFQDRMMMRLAEDERQALVREQGARLFEPMPGRPMREYVEVPPAILKQPKLLQEWAARSAQYTASLPPKARAARKKAPAPRKKP